MGDRIGVVEPPDRLQSQSAGSGPGDDGRRWTTMDRVTAIEELETWPVPAAAAGALRLDRSSGRVETLFVAGETGRPFRWASVTKPCTALTFVVAMEEGTVGLDDAAGPPGATVAHLLAHASGLGPTGEVLSPPGRRRIYSNTGFDELSRHLAGRAGMAYEDYLNEGVLEPLGMSGVTVPADGAASSALSGTLDDLLALARELLRPTLVAAASLDAATAVAFPGLDGVLPGFGPQRPCDWGLGFEVRDGKHPHYTGAANSPATFGHFGQAGGMLWVDPVAGVAAAVLTDRDFGPWAVDAWPRFSDAVLADALRADAVLADAAAPLPSPPV
jgi:CubicO group peptidase (beta-lactamase class C family)